MKKILVRKGQYRIEYNCYYCGKVMTDRESHYNKKIKHFCSMACYAKYRKDAPPESQPTWRGGVSRAESHKRWVVKNPERIAHLKARRYARERGADGSHTLEEWESLKNRYGNKCAFCKQQKPLTKDHIIPLSKGGTDYISNIQPLCRSCNSKKWAKILPIHENPELMEAI